MTPVIATTKILAQRPGEEPFELEVQIGTPYKIDSDEWACPVAVTPLYRQLHDAHGTCSFQALCLASALALDLLQGFKEKGGSLFIAPGEEFPLEAYSFGIAARAPAGGDLAHFDG